MIESLSLSHERLMCIHTSAGLMVRWRARDRVSERRRLVYMKVGSKRPTEREIGERAPD